MRRRLLLLLPLLAACASSDSGSAMCVMPNAQVMPVSARPGDVLLVTAVLPGPCNDTGDDHAPVLRRDVAVTLSQQGVVTELAVVPDDDLAIEARVVVPQSATPGPAEVVVGDEVAADLVVLGP